MGRFSTNQALSVPVRNIAVLKARNSLPGVIGDSNVIRSWNEHNESETQNGPSSVVVSLVDVNPGEEQAADDTHHSPKKEQQCRQTDGCGWGEREEN